MQKKHIHKIPVHVGGREGSKGIVGESTQLQLRWLEKAEGQSAKVAFIFPISQQKLTSFICSPGLCSQQLVVVGGPLVVVLSVSDDCGQAFADQSFCNVTGRDERTETGATSATGTQANLPGPTCSCSAGPRGFHFQSRGIKAGLSTFD